MRLTIGDLRKLIEGQPDDAEVVLEMTDGCCGDTLDLDYEESRTSLEDYDKKPGYIVLRTAPLPGYRSCIQSGGTKEADKEYWAKFKKG